MTVTIKHLYIAPAHNYFGSDEQTTEDHRMIERTSIDVKASHGIDNDFHIDDDDPDRREITLFDWSIFQVVRDEIVGEEIRPSNIERNVFIEGVDLHSLIDKRFTIGGVEFAGSCEVPSPWMDKTCSDGTHDALKERAGIRARILGDGRLDLGSYELEVVGDV